MSQNLSFPFHFATLTQCASEEMLQVPLLYAGAVHVHTSGSGLARHFKKAFEKTYLETGRYREVLRSVIHAPMDEIELSVEVRESRDGFRHPPSSFPLLLLSRRFRPTTSLGLYLLSALMPWLRSEPLFGASSPKRLSWSSSGRNGWVIHIAC